MDEALRTLLIAVLGAAAMAITSWGMTRRARGQIADQFALADADRQKQANERERQINASLEEFRTLFAGERLLRIKRDEKISELYDRINTQATALALLQESQKRDAETIAGLTSRNQTLTEAQATDRARIVALEDDKRDQSRRIRELNTRIEKVEQERNAALALVDIRNGELVKANEKISRLEQDLASTQGELEATVRRVTALEGKPDTGKLNTAALPPGIEPTADALARHESEKDGD